MATTRLGLAGPSAAYGTFLPKAAGGATDYGITSGMSMTGVGH